MPTDPEQLRTWLAAAGQQDAVAFRALYNAAAPKLLGFALRILRKRELAEEALQEGFVSIWHAAPHYQAGLAAPLTWMAAIVRNRSLDLVRRSRETPDVDDALAAQLVDESAHPAQDAEAHAEAHSLERCLAELDAEQRQSIALAFFHGLTHSELAAHLDRPLGTVKTHVRRGLLKLRDCLMRAGHR